MGRKRSHILLALAVVLAALAPRRVAAEPKEIRIGVQYGLTYLVLMIVESERLVESEAKKLGIEDVKVTWVRSAGGPQLNDALLSGNLDMACTGATSFLNLWDKSKGKFVKGLFGYGHIPFTLVTRIPGVKTVADFTDKDRIALPAVRSSTQAMYLQMAAEKAFGPGGLTRLDPLTVSRAHPDGMAALLGNTEITAHFTAPPYTQLELAAPGMHKVIETEDVVGQPISNGIVYATERFYAEQPRLVEAVRGALTQAVNLINTDKRRAAEIYKAANPRDKIEIDTLIGIIGGEKTGWEITPLGTMIFARHMVKTGQIKVLADNWKDLFFPIAHDLPGN